MKFATSAVVLLEGVHPLGLSHGNMRPEALLQDEDSNIWVGHGGQQTPMHATLATKTAAGGHPQLGVPLHCNNDQRYHQL